ncbi:hypothetical protein RJ640_016276 [Escallonia rubra]|uniref:AT-hook motif nuclear-localized protein n=1 Tax=Escallonia rubra TaxID=112253 RepID=A0AA88QL22_9ASTE|nr:hypothetical protein RJ640_016276 [Escallonia rubra]
MEPDDSGGLSSYYHQTPPPLHLHQHHHQNPPPTTASTASPTNGILPSVADRSPHVVYPHSAPSAASSPLEPIRRKRGRPRKYGTPEQAAAAKRLSASSPAGTTPSVARKKDQSGLGGGGAPSSSATTSYKKSQLAALGNAGQGFTPHIISVAAGERSCGDDEASLSVSQSLCLLLSTRLRGVSSQER